LAPASCNLLQFGSMIKHKTGKSWVSYNGYGCYCGWGGSKQPLDATDWCCHAHDCCYKKLTSSHCSPKFVKYQFSTQGSQIICGSGTSCERQTCECDRR
ncbi:Group IIE secretory phospholipase A2, partial [Antrostomus carolinensis]